MGWTKDTITIRGKEVPVKFGKLNQSNLSFFVDNPRIYSIVRADEETPDQEEIQEKLLSMEYVKSLIQDIKSNGGLIDPVVVRDGTFEVLEGNSRLAAYRWLCSKDPAKWAQMKCMLLPKDISDADVFALLGQYHIKGKKDWAPFEQAGFLYRRHKGQGTTISDLSEEIGIGPRRVGQLIDTYQFMIDHKDKNINRWSYYEEFIKSNNIKKLRKDFPELDDVFVKQVKNGAIDKAVYVRDKLARMSSAQSKVVKKYVAGELTLDQAFDLVETSGNNDATYRRLSAFRQWLVSEETGEAVDAAGIPVKKKLQFELKKIHNESKRLLRKCED